MSEHAPPTMCCENCRFWDFTAPSLPSAQFGHCRCKPPMLGRDNGRGLWPVTADRDWCGAFSLSEYAR